MTAILSGCGLYRYRLERAVRTDLAGDHQGKTIAFIGVNPSTADATVNDSTVRKWSGFCQRWGVSHYIVGNAFALRATDVRMLKRHDDPIGPANRDHLVAIASSADILVPCWGSRAKLPRELHYRLDETLEVLRSTGKPIKIFGLSKTGDPLHPLMLGYNTKLVTLGEDIIHAA